MSDSPVHPPPPPPDHGNQSSEGSSTTPVSVECCVCGRRFEKRKALFGHMRCHPEREWRGVRPEFGAGRTKKRRRKAHESPPVNPAKEQYVWGDCGSVAGKMQAYMMVNRVDVKGIAPVVGDGGERGQHFATRHGLRYCSRIRRQGEMEKEKGKGVVVGGGEESGGMKQRQRRERRGCVVDLNLPPPVEEERDGGGKKA